MCMNILPACVPGASQRQERLSDALEVKLGMVVSHCVGAGTSVRTPNAFNYWAIISLALFSHSWWVGLPAVCGFSSSSFELCIFRFLKDSFTECSIESSLAPHFSYVKNTVPLIFWSLVSGEERVCLHKCSACRVQKKDPCGAAVRSGCELPNVGAGVSPLVFGKSSKLSYLLSHFSSPHAQVLNKHISF